MFSLYSFLYTLGFLLLLPRFLIDAFVGGKYVAGFRQRMGFVPRLDHSRRTVWLHCVSVGEVNAARPLAALLTERRPDIRLVVSTTTKTGQKHAKEVFAKTADLVFYFPFDWRSTVRRTLDRISPRVILLTETEIWFNFIRESSKSRARIAIINGRLSERSFKRYGYINRFMRRVLGYIDLAAMQDKADASRIMSLGMRASKVRVTGNLKFDHSLDAGESELTQEFRDRFAITPNEPLIVAASTHAPEEQIVLDAFKTVWKSTSENLPRLLIAPRHPERFAEVVDLVKRSGFVWVRRTEKPSQRDKAAEVIILDSIGELRSVYPLAELVFVGGSLIEHGGQSIFEPAAAGKAVITGPHTENFSAAVEDFLARDALIRIGRQKNVNGYTVALANEFSALLKDTYRREYLGKNALTAMETNRGAAEQTLEYLLPLIGPRS
jgi:3-deoxy-D-manno-octulosonic-acid transferase